MTKDTKQSAEQLQKEAIKKQENEDKKLLEKLPKEEQKIVKKNMKNRKLSAKQAIYGRFLDQNKDKAQKLYEKFIEEFNQLGFYLKPYMQRSETKTEAKIAVDALTVDGYDNVKQFYINKNKKDDKTDNKPEEKASEEASV